MSRHDADPAAALRRLSDRPPRSRRAITLVVALVLGTALGPVAIGSAAGVGSPVGADAQYVASTSAPPGVTTSSQPAASIGAPPAASTAAPTVGTSSPGAEPTLVVSDATVDPDATETHRVALTDAPDGLAGFELSLALEAGDVATVTDASYPDHFGLTTDPVVSAEGRTITVEAVDLGDEVSRGATDVTLAEIDVTGADHGETTLRVTELQIDADGGNAVDPSLEAGTVTVGDGATGAKTGTGNEGSETGSGSSGSESDGNDVESHPGFAVGPAFAAIAVLLALVFAQLR